MAAVADTALSFTVCFMAISDPESHQHGTNFGWRKMRLKPNITRAQPRKRVWVKLRELAIIRVGLFFVGLL